MDTTKPVTQSASFKNYIHLTVISCIYTILVIANWRIADPLSSNFEMFGAAMSLATGHLVAVWSVFGPGKLIVRFLLAHAIGAPVIIANSYGQWDTLRNISPLSNISLSASIQIGILMAFVLSIAIQIPFWFMRFLKGWRLAIRGDDSTSSVPLSELFVLTFIFGLAFATPRIADEVMIKSLLSQLEIGSGFHEVNQTSPTSWTGTDVTVTADNIERLRSNIKDNSIYFASPNLYPIAFASAILALFLLPIFVIMFRTRNCPLAIVYSMLVGIIVLVIHVALVSVFNPGLPAGAYAQVVGGQMILVGVALTGFSIPLLVTRRRGFVLLSPKGRKFPVENEHDSNLEYPSSIHDTYARMNGLSNR